MRQEKQLLKKKREKFLKNFLKYFPAVHLNTRKGPRHCSQKERFIKSLLTSIILMF